VITPPAATTILRTTQAGARRSLGDHHLASRFQGKIISTVYPTRIKRDDHPPRQPLGSAVAAQRTDRAQRKPARTTIRETVCRRLIVPHPAGMPPHEGSP
jgi:hypothetical protein